jgi:hypothetical protein
MVDNTKGDKLKKTNIKVVAPLLPGKDEKKFEVFA